jgi:DNA polymerase III subunit alpha
MIMQPSFVHLKVHSDYSLVHGLPKVKALIEQAQACKIPALALTDEMNFFGLIKFYQAAQKAGVKPIIGADVLVVDPANPAQPFALTLLAMNRLGYKNLKLLLSRGYQQGYGRLRPHVQLSWLQEYAEGVLVLSGGMKGDLGQALLKKNAQQVQTCLDFYQTYFPNRFYIEVSRLGHDHEAAYIEAAVSVAVEHQLPLVATNDVMFLAEDDFEAHEIRVAIHDGFTLMDPKRPKRYTAQQYLKSSATMQALFGDLPAALANTVEIAKRCNVDLSLDEYFLPNFPTGDLSTADYLIQVSQQGLIRRLQQLILEPQAKEAVHIEYEQRLQLELAVINKMGFPGYFLIVMEFIQWAKDQGIPVGPGRGSGAGSLVAYALGITDIDPIKFDLLFERFLNPERVSMPDFDIDFCMEDRDKVIEHTSDVYGRDAVSQIITFGTMAAKAVIRDVGRVLGHNYGFVDRIAKLIPPDPGMTLAKAFDLEPSLTQLCESNEDVKELLDIAKALEGVTRNAGKHAGGVVISPTKITDFAPIYCDQDGLNPVTQFDKNDVETAGLVKFDFLGLRTLTIIDWAVKAINQVRDPSLPPVAIDQIPLDDPEAFKLLKQATTTAVFQLESRGMKDLIKRLQPDCFEDIIALVALFRPGPLQSGMVDNFIDRKHAREAIAYPDAQYQHPCLQPILEPTYGIILYQEQVMQIAQEMAGYTLGGADLLRRAMGKKKPEEMAKQRQVFESGAQQNNIDGELAIKIFDLVEKFAGYGFNKSHSAAYALVSYQTLWLKVHYPAYFMAAVLSADMDNTDKVVLLIEECQRMGLSVYAPDVNQGSFYFTADTAGSIIYGLGAIKGVGEAVVNNITSIRQTKPFADLFDFCTRVDLKKANKRVLEKLILSGSMDAFAEDRAVLMHNLPRAVAMASQHVHATACGQADLFGLLEPSADTAAQTTLMPCQPWSLKVRLEGERETLGLYLTGHPYMQYEVELAHHVPLRLEQIKASLTKKRTVVAGLVIQVRRLITKRGAKMAVFTLDDQTSRLEVVLLGEAYEQFNECIHQDEILIVEGEVSHDEYRDALKMTARQVDTLITFRDRYVTALKIDFKPQTIHHETLVAFEACLQLYKGGVTPVVLEINQDDSYGQLQLGEAWSVHVHDALLDELSCLFGDEHVKVCYGNKLIGKGL